MYPRNNQVIDPRNLHGQSMSQPPPIPPRTNVSQDGYHGPGIYGWNLPPEPQVLNLQAHSGQIQHGSREQKTSFQGTGEQLDSDSTAASLDYSEKLVVKMPELVYPSSLITLDTSLTCHTNDPQTYSSELKGIDFTPSDQQRSFKDSRVHSSSAEDLRDSQRKETYPEIRHMFYDVQPPSQYGPTFNSQSQASMAQTSGYGWNPIVCNSYGGETGVYNYCSMPSAQPFSPAPFTPAGAYSSQMMHNANKNPFFGYNNRPESLAFLPDVNVCVNSSTSSLPRSQSCSDIETLDFETGEQIESVSVGKGDNQNTNGDLMELHDEGILEDEYMSLDYFDPLYAKSRRDSVSQHTYEGVPPFSFLGPENHYHLATSDPIPPDSWVSLGSSAVKKEVGLYPSLSTSFNEDVRAIERQGSGESDSSIYHDYTELDLNVNHKPENVVKEDYEDLLRTKSGKLMNYSGEKISPPRPAPPSWRMTKVCNKIVSLLKEMDGTGRGSCWGGTYMYLYSLSYGVSTTTSASFQGLHAIVRHSVSNLYTCLSEF